MKRLAYLILVLIFASCQSNEKRIKASDTVSILNTVFTSRTFLKTLSNNDDTVYVLKSKNYNSSWPGRVNQVFIKYIDDTPKARVANDGNPIADARMRYGFPIFSIKNDSAKVAFYNYNFVIDMGYTLCKKSDGWQIVKYSVRMR